VPSPTIEIHRCISAGSGIDKKPLKKQEWENRFRESLLSCLPKRSKVEVFLWDEMHDRYLISNIVGINIPNGFDTSRRKPALTTWQKLDEKERDAIQREFDENSLDHKLQGRFTLVS